MNFKPQSAADIAAKSKPITGIFPGRVHSAEDCTSKKGVDMIKLDVTVYVGERTFEKTTYLHPAMEVLVYNFCKNADLLEQYQQGDLCAEMCEGKDVMVKLGIEKGKDGYPDKSAIKDFMPKDTPETKLAAPAVNAPATRPKPPADPDLDTQPDDIPFAIVFPILLPALTALHLFAC